MSMKLPRRLSSKKKKPPKDNAQAEVLHNLGLEEFWTTPLDRASMLEIPTWAVNNPAPLEPRDLPNAFLQRLWLLNPDARSTCLQHPGDVLINDDKSTEMNGFGEVSRCAVSPLDLVTAVFMSADTFLQQDMTAHMVQCQFAVPLVLPSLNPEEPSRFLLWPLRDIVIQWTSRSLENHRKVQEGDLASTCMPMVSCVKIGHCGVSKSQVLNHIMSGLRSCSETFLHRGMDGGQLPRRLSNGLVEIGWYLPTRDTDRDTFPIPVVISNLRGDASTHEKSLRLLCRASSATIVFCGNLREKEKQLLVSCKGMASKLILVDISDSDKNENTVVGFAGLNLEEIMGLPVGSVLHGKDLSEEELANELCDTLKNLLPDKLKHVTLEAAANLAVELGLSVDEGAVCKKAMAKAENVLKGLDEGSAQFRERQLPLQGSLWRKLAEIQKEESKQKKEGSNIDVQLLKEKTDILAELWSYKMTPAMKSFTSALYTTDKVERTYFLSWMKILLKQKQTAKQNGAQHLLTNQQTEKRNGMPEDSHSQNGATDDYSDSFSLDSTFEEELTEEQPENGGVSASDRQFQNGHIFHNGTHEGVEPQSEQKHLLSTCDPVPDQQLHLMSEIPLRSDSTSSPKQLMSSDVSTEPQVASCSQPLKPNLPSLGLDHFLREMGLILELTHISPGSERQNVLRLPSVAADLLLYGVPLELMDGDASNIPIRWLGCVFAELQRRLPQERCKTRVLTNLGVHHARNAEVLSALFGVKFPVGSQRKTRGVYMVALCLPDSLKKSMMCDFLLLINVEGLCSTYEDDKVNIKKHDDEMVTFATGLSDVVLQNISSLVSAGLEEEFTITVNALLRIKEHGYMPDCQLLIQDEGINSLLQASQLKRVSEMLQPGGRGTNNAYEQNTNSPSCITYVRGPWSSMSNCEPVDTNYSAAVFKLKKNLYGALKRCALQSEAKGLPEFTIRLNAVWDAVKEESFSVGLQNNDIASAFSLLCTEFSQWEASFLEHTESWLMVAGKKIFDTKEKALDAELQNNLLEELKVEAGAEVKAEADHLAANGQAYLMNDNLLRERADTFKPILMSYIDDLRERVTKDIIQRLATVNESHCSSVQLRKFETLLEKEQGSKLFTLLENSNSTNVLLQDEQLEEEFAGVWSKTLSSFDFRPSEVDNITARVTNTLRQNLISRGLQKHIFKIEEIGQNQTAGFQVYDEHFGYRSRLKHMFEDNNRLQRLEAQRVACNVIEEYTQFVADKCSLPADFSDGYITEILEKVEKALKEKSIEIRSAFEVDLKVYLCSAACQDFQKLHDRFAKDRELLTFITVAKSSYLAKFIYRFRKRDQCQRVAQSFTSMVIKPTVLEYVHRPLGMRIADEIQSKKLQYRSSRAFNHSLLEDLLKEDKFESFLEYLQSYDSFRLRKIGETVVAHLSESSDVNTWRQQRLGEIVGKVAAAVSQTAEGTNGVLSDTKPLLERVCLILESDGDLEVARTCLDGPLFTITTEWDRLVTCLMGLLAAMRLDLAQEYAHKVDITQLLACLPIQPQQSLFNRVRGCDRRCPLCGAPCEEGQIRHEVHGALLHRPEDMLPSDLGQSNPGPNDDTHNTSIACRNLLSLHPDWNRHPEEPSSLMPIAYWRYVLVRFIERFAKEYERTPAEIPEPWRKITEEEALGSLREALLDGHR